MFGWFIRVLERHAWTVMAVTISLLLVLPLSIAAGSERARPMAQSELGAVLTQAVIAWLAGVTLVICIAVMLLMIRAEGRRLDAVREDSRRGRRASELMRSGEVEASRRGVPKRLSSKDEGGSDGANE